MDRSEVSETWIYYVVIPIGDSQFLSRLHVMDSWLSEWQIPYEVLSSFDYSALLIRFPTELFAHAFIAADDAGGASFPTSQQ